MHTQNCLLLQLHSFSFCCDVQLPVVAVDNDRIAAPAVAAVDNDRIAVPAVVAEKYGFDALLIVSI